MNDDGVLRRQRLGVEHSVPAGQYTAKDFQLEVLTKLAETQELAESLQESWQEMKSSRESRMLRFDSRTLIAIAAVVVSIAGYFVQDVRNSARQDTEIEATKSRIVRLEQIAAANTEGRVRLEVELEALRDGQAEIKRMIAAHDSKSGDTVGTRARKINSADSGRE